MSTRGEGYALMAVILVLSCGLQILLKQFSGDIAPVFLRHAPEGTSRAGILLSAILSWRGLAIGVVGVSLVLLWLMALARLDLSLALPLAAVALAINALVGGVILGETISLVRMGGIVVITAGILLVVVS